MFCLWKVLFTLSDNTIADLLEKIAGMSLEKLSFTFKPKIVVYNPQINWYGVGLGRGIYVL